MKHAKAIGIVMANIFAFSASAVQAQSISCGAGNVIEKDLSKGEMLLNDSDLIKVPIGDQDKIDNILKGRSFLRASTQDVIRYRLKQESGWQWVFAVAAGKFGRTFQEARKNFIISKSINASYFPATKKVVVSTLVPAVAEAKVFRFWVLVHVPSDALIVDHDCGTFK